MKKLRKKYDDGIIAGGKSLYASSGSGVQFSDPYVAWDWLTEAIQDKWCDRFELALMSYNEESPNDQ